MVRCQLVDVQGRAYLVTCAVPDGSWQVEAIYDYVLDHVEYVEGPDKSALEALHDKQADCQGRSMLFIALCRARKVPARAVWVPDHTYPEFYLEDANGKGHWYPCQAAGASDGDERSLHHRCRDQDVLRDPRSGTPDAAAARRQWRDRVATVGTPLFPGYVFCRFIATNRLPILTTPGVFSVVSVAKAPAPIPDAANRRPSAPRR